MTNQTIQLTGMLKQAVEGLVECDPSKMTLVELHKLFCEANEIGSALDKVQKAIRSHVEPTLEANGGHLAVDANRSFDYEMKKGSVGIGNLTKNLLADGRYNTMEVESLKEKSRNADVKQFRARMK